MKQKDHLENVFVCELETYNDQEFAEAYAAGLYDVNLLRYRWDRDLTPEEIQSEWKYIIVFINSCGNLVMNMLTSISENYEWDERTYINKDGDEIVSSYRISLWAQDSTEFGSLGRFESNGYIGWGKDRFEIYKNC